MAIGRISGPMLYSNLERQGANLVIDTDLLHFDVVNRRVGINTVSPGQDLDVPGNVRLASLSILNNAIVSNTGKINLGSTSNVQIAGGTNYDVLYTDGDGNLQFISLNELSTVSGELTGNTIPLGINTVGVFTSNALTFNTLTSVTDSIAELNEVLGLITNSDGSVITTSLIQGVLTTNNQPYVNSVGTLSGLVIGGDLTVTGNTALNGYTNLTISDSIVDLHINSDLTPWDSDDGKDVGLAFHYYKGQDATAFLGWSNTTGYLEWYDTGAETVDNVFNGVTHGTGRMGAMLLVNATVSTSTTTGALQVTGGAGIQGNVNAANLTANTGVFTSINGNLPAPYVQGTVNTANVTLFISTETTSTNNTFYPVFVDKLAGNTAERTNSALNFNPGTGYLSATRFQGDGYFTTAHATNFSSGNIRISGGYLHNLANVVAADTDFENTTSAILNVTQGNITTAAVQNFSTGNAQITGGAITTTPVSGSTGHFTTAQADNFSSGNVSISGGYITGLANVSAAYAYISTLDSDVSTVTQLNSTDANVGTLVSQNFSSGNTQITGGDIVGLSSLVANIASFSISTVDQLNVTHGNITTAAVQNFSTANAQISGGAITTTPVSGSTGHFTTAQAGNFSSGNVAISGGYIAALANATINTTNTTTLNVNDGVIYSLNATLGNITTLTVGNFSSGNVQISGGYVNSLANISSTVALFDNTTSTTVNSTFGNVTTLVATNFSSGNVQISGGYVFAPVVSGTVTTANVGLYQQVSPSTENENFYPVFVNTTDGNAAAYANANWTFNPATGNLALTNFVGNVFGKIITESQPYITTLGNLIYLNVDNDATVTGNVIAGNVLATQISADLVGQVLTTDQPDITSVGTLVSLAVSGNITMDSAIGEFYGNIYTDQIIAQTSNITLTPQDAFVIVNSHNGLVMPLGNTDQRPVGLQGTLRYNTTLATMEFYNGSNWVPFTNTVQSQQFPGDGVTQTITLDYDADQDTILVSINGTLQEPGVAYTVVGTQLTFTEIPQATDVVSIRFIGSLSSPSGGQQFQNITTNVIPAETDTYSIGTADRIWQQLHVNQVSAAGIISTHQLHETFSEITSATGAVAHDCADGQVFYHTTPAGDFTVNLQNLSLTTQHGSVVKLVINQGATAYLPTAVQIAGVPQTIKWANGVAPSGSANSVDVVTFTVLNSAGTYLILAQLTVFS